MPGALGRRTPTDFDHVSRYALSAAPPGAVTTGVPVVIGVNWYSDFDVPEKFGGRWWIARQGIKGSIRGGHCVAIKSGHQSDPLEWWDWYDQGQEGACVGFGCSRMMSLLNRKRYFARCLWDRAKREDEWSDTNPGDDNGTSVRAALNVLRREGHVVWNKKRHTALNAEGNGPFIAERAKCPGVPADGIAAYRWAVNVDEVRMVLKSNLHDRLQAVPILNSWGRSWPHIVWLPYESLGRLIREDGEVGLITDR